MFHIAVDAMGGDHAPAVILEGVSDYLARHPGKARLFLVGVESLIQEHLQRLGLAGHPELEVVHAPDVVAMDEPGEVAVRGKRNSSITTAVDLVRKGEAHAVFSAGNTSAVVFSTVRNLRRLRGVGRPGIAAVFPTPTGPFVLLDAGANVEARPEHLVHYAIMGHVYAIEIMGIENPRLGLLSFGEEEGKGNDLTKEAFRGIRQIESLNFLGNVEGHDLFAHNVDVVVCDGFTGNVVLKSCESLARAVRIFLRAKLTANPLRMAGAWLCRGAFRDLARETDYNEYGGAPLLGVNGVVTIGHGSSNRVAVMNAIRVAGESVEHQVNQHIVTQIQSLV